MASSAFMMRFMSTCSILSAAAARRQIIAERDAKVIGMLLYLALEYGHGGDDGLVYVKRLIQIALIGSCEVLEFVHDAFYPARAFTYVVDETGHGYARVGKGKPAELKISVSELILVKDAFGARQKPARSSELKRMKLFGLFISWAMPGGQSSERRHLVGVDEFRLHERGLLLKPYLFRDVAHRAVDYALPLEPYALAGN